jgi:hypothetical protein
MATRGKPQNKSTFLRELLLSNPNAKEKDAVAAWKQAGNEGTVSSSAFYSAKRESVGAAGGPASASEKTRSKSSPKGPKGERKSKTVRASYPESNGQSHMSESARTVGKRDAQDHSRTLDAVEGGIDDLIFRLKEMGGVPEVEEALRAARRLLYVS